MGENNSYIDTEIVNNDKKIIASNNKIEKKYNYDLDIYIKEKKFLNSEIYQYFNRMAPISKNI